MREDLNALLDSLLPFAQQMLNKSGEFFPFGAVVIVRGGLEMVGADTGTERPPSKEVMELLLGGFRCRARDATIRASGMCYNAGISSPSGAKQDAIILDLESREECARIAVPYAKKFLRGYQFGEIQRIAMDPAVFTSGRPT